ncbi:UBX domain-containing protein 7 [Halocaridina rubra]|uniref:UBX domain-containing protein 7 n=1 Tax=Halocaridina rubra TaxID=373956 RepID=A0AAN9A7P3_HALRR
MPPHRSSRTNRALIDEFCSITGADKALAGSLLEACGNNLEMAINMHMEGVQDASVSSADSSANAPYMEDGVRAPIPQKQEILVGGPDDMAYSFRKRRRVARSVFDKFRDFEAEAKRQEEELLAGATASEVSRGAIACASTSGSLSVSGIERKRKTLEDLFRPPVDLIFRGTFQAARDFGVSQKRWLMVNVQDSSEFPCQVLNRDVWSNSGVKAIIKEHFVFWQVYHDSEEGQRYMMFYQVSDWPYVAVLDPRTGERLVTWQKVDAVSFIDLVTEFLSSHAGLDETSSPQKKKTCTTSNNSILEADEESQIEAAIKASLLETKDKATTPCSEKDSEDEDDQGILESFDSDEEIDYSLRTEKTEIQTAKRSCNGEKKLYVKNTSNSVKSTNTLDKAEEEEDKALLDDKKPCIVDDWKDYLGPTTDPESKLMLRLPDGSRDIISMPSTSKLKALVKFIGTKGYNNEQYELVTNFPRKELSGLDFNTTLRDAGLFPQETIFIQAR